MPLFYSGERFLKKFCACGCLIACPQQDVCDASEGGDDDEGRTSVLTVQDDLYDLPDMRSVGDGAASEFQYLLHVAVSGKGGLAPIWLGLQRGQRSFRLRFLHGQQHASSSLQDKPVEGECKSRSDI